MSYLNTPRLTFSGKFQADVSTVNNDPTHFNNATFNAAYQELTSATNPGGLMYGWWNPDGTGNWRLVGCTVQSVTYRDGTVETDSTKDPVIGMLISDSNTRTAAKLVDLDSQQQMVSEIWGLLVRLVDNEGTQLFSGSYKVAPFTNIWFNRSIDKQADERAGAIYTSVIQGLDYNLAGYIEKSRFIKELLEEMKKTESYELSIQMNVDRYHGNFGTPEFSLGRLTGAIGIAYKEEPKHVVMGRQLFQASGDFNYGVAVYDANSSSLMVDLANSLQFNKSGILDIGELELAIQLPNSTVSLGKIDYKKEGWYMQYGGISQLPVSSDNLSLLNKNPLLITATPTGSSEPATVFSECAEYVRADQFVFRLDPDTNPSNNTFTIDLYASNLGAPVPAGTKINVIQSGLFNQNQAMNGSLELPQSINANNTSPGSISGYQCFPPYLSPTTDSTLNGNFLPLSQLPNGYYSPPQPVNGVPVAALGVSSDQIAPATCTTDSNGKASISLSFSDPGLVRELQYYNSSSSTESSPPYTLESFSPKQYMDGQYYNINYWLGAAPASNANQSNFVSILIFNGSQQTPPNPVQWEDIQPILQQYANLYPIMSKGIFNLASQSDVDQNAEILKIVFSKDPHDPNYMPATRDLSAYKRNLILTYLDQVLAKG